jgi:nucleoid-associated protein YgaU
MGKDYKIGLICGLVAAIAILIWLATRPSLNGRERLLGSPVASSQKPQAPRAADSLDQSLPGSRGTTPSPNGQQPASVQTPRSESPRPTEPPQTARPQPDASATARTHVVRNGETLSSIAQQYYGSPEAWHRIAAANADVVKNPDKVPLGTTLKIP